MGGSPEADARLERLTPHQALTLIGLVVLVAVT
jgi:hypothetical protein